MSTTLPNRIYFRDDLLTGVKVNLRLIHRGIPPVAYILMVLELGARIG